jgi:hypothetical protein
MHSSIFAAGTGPGCRVGLITSLSVSGFGSSRSCRNVARVDVLVKERTACWLYRDLDVVIGVDTHKDTHTTAAVGATGGVLEHLTVPADPAGYRRPFGRRHDATSWAIEATGSFGAGLTTALLARRERIVEVDRPNGRHVVAS